MRQLIVVILVGFCLPAGAQGKISFRTVDEAFIYADAHSSVFKNATQENILSKYQTLAAKLSTWNLKSDANFSATDNTKLGTTFIPAEIFGGPAGTFQKVTFGQQYVSNLNINPQIDLLNLGAEAKVKTARANEQLIHFSHLISRKSLYENLAAAFLNAVSCERQITVTQNSLLNADTLTNIMKNKLNEGVARSQDVNNAIANSLSVTDKLQQLQVQLLEQYNTIKLLCDIDSDTDLQIQDKGLALVNNDDIPEAYGDLLQNQQQWQKNYQEADLRAVLRSFLPTVTLFSSFALQQNTTKRFFDNSQWFASNYIGLRVTLPLVPDVSKLTAVKNARINIIIAGNNLEHARIQDKINNNQLRLEYQKSLGSYRLALQIEALKKDSYLKNLNIYKEGILSATDLLNSLNDWFTAGINTATQYAACAYAYTNIHISNTLK
ncbi:outer membrane efflux protein [Mucilaginibacter gracilis]|uniref:Outer membrane efflux protein n=1 Tax=Mucilaginibacter gracilis TaxID=423350 RepID=A0A495J6V4_9SPHI|nr:TolC family protein [Mucilaginibacter gracilis]RKR84726.1 outer membrane efflux protein [Mucilaginibacter gracilis]